jgi:hypothetical protein
MTTTDEWEEVDVLIPSAILKRRRSAIREACMDLGALVEVLPTLAPSALDASLSAYLADADLSDCKAWAQRVIRALPTRSDMEASNGAT